jgi:hypothetical protein
MYYRKEQQMKFTIETDEGKVIFIAESDGEGRYTIADPTGKTFPRQDQAEGDGSYYETNDGLHVIGLIQLIFGSNDSREYLQRRLKEQA